MKLIEQITKAVSASLEDKGYDLVQIKLINGGKRLIVGIVIERLDNKYISIDDCTIASRLISAILDVEDFIKGAYTLEVSSPGENRPLLKVKDFERFYGKAVKMELFNPINGTRKIVGTLGKLINNSETVIVNFFNGDNEVKLDVPLNNIKKASIKRDF